MTSWSRFQGLDYWIWATANLDLLAGHFEVPALSGASIDFVFASPAAGGPVAGPYTPAQMEALSGEIPWRVWLCRRTGSLGLSPSSAYGPGPRRTCRVPEAVAPRWATRLNAHLRDHAAGLSVPLTHGGQCFADPRDGLVGAAVAVWETEVAPAGLAHTWLPNVRSSQLFALNLFANLDPAGRISLAKDAGLWGIEHVGPPLFEYSDQDDRLRESTGPSGHRTQVDVLYRCHDDAGALHLLLIEVKLSESDFGGCSAWASPNNDRLDLCASPHPFGGHPEGCFQLRNHDQGERRRYDTAIGILSEVPSGTGCWWRASGNQPMRLFALAKALVNDGLASSARLALCAPLRHRSIWRRWAETNARLEGSPAVGLATLPAEEVLCHLDIGTAELLAARYQLDVRPARRRHELAAWNRMIQERFPNGARIRVTDEEGRTTLWAPHNMPVYVIDFDRELFVVVGEPEGYNAWQAPIHAAHLDGTGWTESRSGWVITLTDRPCVHELVYDPSADAPWAWASGSWTPRSR